MYYVRVYFSEYVAYHMLFTFEDMVSSCTTGCTLLLWMLYYRPHSLLISSLVSDDCSLLSHSKDATRSKIQASYPYIKLTSCQSVFIQQQQY